MSLPSTKVEIAFDSGYTTPAASRTWTDVSTYVEGAYPLTIGRGRSDEVSAIQPSRLALTLNNKDGRFTPRLTTGAYYPNVKKGRPARVSVSLVSNAGFETNVTGYTGSNATLARSTAQAHSGVASMSITATAAANALAVDSGSGTGGIPVEASTVYPVAVWARAATTARLIQLRVDWWTSAGAFISTSVGTGISDATGSWTLIDEEFTSPATAAYARRQVVVASPAASEVHYVDDFTFDLPRYTGYVSEWPVSWPDGTSADCVVSLTSASRMSRMGRGAELKSIIEEEILADSPVAYYTLGEPAGATSAADHSGNQAPMLTMAGTGTDVVFGNATGPPTDGLTAAEFAGGAQKGLQAVLPSAPAAIELWLATTAVSSYILLLGDGVANTMSIDGTGLLVVGGAGTVVVNDGAWHHIVWNGADNDVYVDSVLAATTATGTGFTGFRLGGFAGAAAHVATYSSTLSAARVTAHYTAGGDGFAGESAGARIERYASYASIPAAELDIDTGDSVIGHFDITGMTPLAAMAKVVETENGVLYDACDGDLTFRGRDARYNLTSAFSLDVTAQEVEADLEPKDDDQFMVNDVTATANGQPAGRVIDATSRDEHGVHSKSLDTVTDDAADALAGAQWAVAQGKDPAPRYSSVTVDVTNSSTAQAAAVLAADIGTRFTLANLPSQVESTTDLFVEGYTETITATRHTITFNTSPAGGYDVWTIEDAVFGQYDAYPIAF